MAIWVKREKSGAILDRLCMYGVRTYTQRKRGKCVFKVSLSSNCNKTPSPPTERGSHIVLPGMWKDTRASELAVGRISSSSPLIRMHILDKAGESVLAAERLKEQNGFSRRSLRRDRHFNEGLQSRAQFVVF